MQYTIVITKQADPLWRAFAPGWPDCVAEGNSREEVLSQIKRKLTDAVNHSEIVQINLPLNNELKANGEWSDFGIFKDDPTWKNLFAEIEENRNKSLNAE